MRLQRAVDHILSLHKLAFERLDSAPTFRASPGAADYGSADNSRAQRPQPTLVSTSARTLQREAARGMHTPELGACLALFRRQLHALLALSLAFALLSPLPAFL